MPKLRALAAILSVALLGAGALSVQLGCKGSPEPTASAAPGSASPSPSPVDPNARRVEITASEKGFIPASIPAKKGESLTLRFTRTTETECVKAVEFPDLKIKRDLPMNTPVDIPIRAEKAGEIKFQCWMAMVFGKVVVE